LFALIAFVYAGFILQMFFYENIYGAVLS